jgi:hypothetical protein
MPQLLNFDAFCSQVSLTVCPLVGSRIEPACYSRNVEIVKDSLIFQPGTLLSLLYKSLLLLATLVIHVVALIMTSIMIYHIKSKYTAVGKCFTDETL